MSWKCIGDKERCYSFLWLTKVSSSGQSMVFKDETDLICYSYNWVGSVASEKNILYTCPGELKCEKINTSFTPDRLPSHRHSSLHSRLSSVPMFPSISVNRCQGTMPPCVFETKSLMSSHKNKAFSLLRKDPFLRQQRQWLLIWEHKSRIGTSVGILLWSMKLMCVGRYITNGNRKGWKSWNDTDF